MSALTLNIAPAPELLTGVPGGAPTTAGTDGRIPANAETPAKPFAALLSGFLQGAQPPAQAAGPSGEDLSLASVFEELPDSGADAATLLALPDSAPPLPALPGNTIDAGGSSGRALPVTGNPLPASLAVPRDPASEPRVPDPHATPVADTSVAAAARPRISLADLALSRPLEAAPAVAAAVDSATAGPAAPSLAGRSLTPKVARANQPTSTSQSFPPRAVTQILTQIADTAAVATGADKLILPLTAADFPGVPVVPGAGTEFLAGPLAAFAANNDGGTPSLATAAAGGSDGPGGADSGSAAQLSRFGSTTTPALQPLGANQSFAGGLADRLLTLGGPGAHSARLQLHPEHLGELNVEIQIDDGSAQVWFGTTTSQARDAIEASLPRLRELFADQGLALTRTQLDGSSGQMGNQHSDPQRRMAAGRPAEADLRWRSGARSGSVPSAGLPPPARLSTRLIDAWA